MGSDLSAGNSVHLNHGGGFGEGWSLGVGMCGDLRRMVRSMDSLGEVKLAVSMHWDFNDLGLK